MFARDALDRTRRDTGSRRGGAGRRPERRRRRGRRRVRLPRCGRARRERFQGHQTALAPRRRRDRPEQAAIAYMPSRWSMCPRAVQIEESLAPTDRPRTVWQGSGRAMPVTPIDTADPTRPGGYFADAGEYVPEGARWPNGYRAFYCIKHSITQGQFVTFLNSVRGVKYWRYFNGNTVRGLILNPTVPDCTMAGCMA